MHVRAPERMGAWVTAREVAEGCTWPSTGLGHQNARIAINPSGPGCSPGCSRMLVMPDGWINHTCNANCNAGPPCELLVADGVPQHRAAVQGDDRGVIAAGGQQMQHSRIVSG